MLPVKHTFIHFGHQPAKRCRSAPPEVWVEIALAQAERRELLARRRAAKRFARISKRWNALVEKIKDLEEKQFAESVRDILAKQLMRTTPRLRARMPQSLYREFAYVILPDKLQEKLLIHMGVIREGQRDVQLWCADEPLENPTMRLLLDYATRFLQIATSGCFHIIMENEVPMTVKLKGVKKEDLRRLIDRRWHLPPLKQLLLHVGRPLQNGPLADQGISPGACARVFNRDSLKRA